MGEKLTFKSLMDSVGRKFSSRSDDENLMFCVTILIRTACELREDGHTKEQINESLGVPDDLRQLFWKDVERLQQAHNGGRN